MVREFHPAGYHVDHALVPHGIAVILHTPAVVRFTAPACPERHLRAAQALGVDTTDAPLEEAGEILAQRVIGFLRELNIPNGLSAVGYGPLDIPALVQGTLPQHRVTKLSPIPAGEQELANLFQASLKIW